MTAINAGLAGPLSLLNRDFQSQFLQSIEALTASTAPADQLAPSEYRTYALASSDKVAARMIDAGV